MKKIGINIIIGLFLFIGLKSCIVIPISIDNYVLLENSDEMSILDRILLTPNEEIIYFKKNHEFDEFIIYKLHGKEATHCIFDFYCIGSFPFGLKFYNNAEKVLDSELKLIKNKGRNLSSAEKEFKTKIVIYKDKTIIGETLFNRIEFSEEKEEEINIILNSLL